MYRSYVYIHMSLSATIISLVFDVLKTITDVQVQTRGEIASIQETSIGNMVCRTEKWLYFSSEDLFGSANGNE